MQHRISEKINDLFLLSIGDLETTLVGSVIRFNTQPQRLIEDIQSNLNDFKSKIFGSLIQMIQLVSNCGQDIRHIAEALEQQVVKCKQTHLLFQMKGMVNCKIKALMETLKYTSQANQVEMQKQVQLLQESLQKIEITLNQSQVSSPIQTTYITPLPRRQQFFESHEGLTPILSEDAEKKVSFITPDQYKVNVHQHQQVEQYNTQFQYTPLSNVQVHLESSLLLNKTLNSFNNDHPEQRERDMTCHSDPIQKLIQTAYDKHNQQQKLDTDSQFSIQQSKQHDLSLPQFGGSEDSRQLPEDPRSSADGPKIVHFENEFMTERIQNAELDDEDHSDYHEYVESPKKYYAKKPPHTRTATQQSAKSMKSSTQSLSQFTNQSPGVRQNNSSNSKAPIQRKQITSGVNLMSKLMQAEKENSQQNRPVGRKVTTPVIKQKPKQQDSTKKPSAASASGKILKYK